jgi:hypothetical protein
LAGLTHYKVVKPHNKCFPGLKSYLKMSYKQTYYFIATCLTISFEKNNKLIIEKTLQSKTIDWDAVVKLSTQQLVFPALYCNLKRAGFLHYLPTDLVNYMELITGLNRERNQQISTQARALNTLLLNHGLTPIFLKGTGNLLAGLYTDIAERMIGDIDFILPKEQYTKAIALLRKDGYTDVLKYHYHLPMQRHYRRIKKENNIAALEIHKELLIEKYTAEFNYDFIRKDIQTINQISLLSYANKLNLSIIANQITDHEFYYKTIPLRNSYDVFLLSKKTNAQQAVNNLYKLKDPLQCFLAGCFEVFNSPDSLQYVKTRKTAAYVKRFKNQFTNTKKVRRKRLVIKNYLALKLFLHTLYRCLVYKEYTIWLLHKMTDKNWYKEKFSFLIPKKKS